jgi:hypothetical protein
MKRRSWILPYLCLWAAFSAQAAPSSSGASASEDNLDQKRIHSEYNDGNFEKVVIALEGFMANHKTYTLQDSVFIAKHLAVVYSANPDTREKGKYYMYRLLSLLPSAKLVDMFVSDEIDRIFDKIREEFVNRQRGFGVDTSRIAVPEKAPTGSRGSASGPREQETPRTAGSTGSKRGHAGLWIAGGAAVAAAGLAATYFLMQGEEQSQPVDRVYSIPKN